MSMITRCSIALGLALLPSLWGQDVVIYGGTPGGIAAAVSVARMGHEVMCLICKYLWKLGAEGHLPQPHCVAEPLFAIVSGAGPPHLAVCRGMNAFPIAAP